MILAPPFLLRNLQQQNHIPIREDQDCLWERALDAVQRSGSLRDDLPLENGLVLFVIFLLIPRLSPLKPHLFSPPLRSSSPTYLAQQIQNPFHYAPDEVDEQDQPHERVRRAAREAAQSGGGGGRAVHYHGLV